jgi:hypothetical protein
LTTVEETPTPTQDDTIKKPHIFEAIFSVLNDVTFVPKAGEYSTSDYVAGGKAPKSSDVKYKYRKFDDLAAELGKSFRVHGIFVQSETLSHYYDIRDKPYSSGSGSATWISSQVRMRYRFTSLTDGSTLVAEAYGEGRDLSDKATGKAMTMAMKSALTQAFMLPTDDPDPDSQRPGDESYGQSVRQGQRPASAGPQQTPVSGQNLTEAEKRHATAQWYLQKMQTPGITPEQLNSLIGGAKQRHLIGYVINGAPLQAHFAAAGMTLGQAPVSGEPPPDYPEEM